MITADVDTNMNDVRHIKGRILLSKYLFMKLLDRQEERQTKQRYGNRDRDRYREQEKKRDKENEEGKRRRTEEETDNRQQADSLLEEGERDEMRDTVRQYVSGQHIPKERKEKKIR